jgi:hypothetical protein
MQLDEACESGVDLAFGAGLQDRELHPLGARRFLYVSYHALGKTRVALVYQQGDHPGLGNQLGKQFKPLGRQLGDHECHAGEVAAWPGKSGDQAGRDRVAAAAENDRDRRGCVFRRERRNVAALGHDQVDIAGDQLGGQCG